MRSRPTWHLWLVIIAILFAPALLRAETDYRKPVPSLPTTLDPKHYADAYSILVATQIFDHLFDIDSYLNIKPKLATKWENREDGRIWVFTLRTDVKFHDGKPMTAEDVAYSLTRLLEKGSIRYMEFSIIKGAREYYDGKAKKVAGIRILAPDKIEIELLFAFQPFLSMLTSPNTEILPANLRGETPAKFFEHPIGTGPFMFQSATPKNVTLIANPNYFLGAPRLARIIFEESDLKQAIEGFNKGYYHDLEWYFEINPQEITRSYTMYKAPSAATNILAMNLTRRPFDNIHFRRALAYAIDKQQLLSLCFKDRIPAKGYIPPGIGGYTPDITTIPFDLEKAKEELKLAKLKPEDLSRQYTMLRPNNHPCQESFDAFIRDSFKKIGLNVKVQPMSLGKIISDYYIPPKYDMFNMFFPADHPEAIFLLNNFRSNHPSNFTGLKSQDIDKLLAKAETLPDRYERFQIYKQIQEILNRDLPIIPLFYNIYAGIYQSNVRGITTAPLTIYALPMASFYFSNDTFAPPR